MIAALLVVAARVLEALPVLAMACAFWAHWRVDNAEQAAELQTVKLAETRMELFDLIETLELANRRGDPPGELADLLRAEFPDYTKPDDMRFRERVS